MELHACHPSCHVTMYGHITIRHIVCSMVIVPGAGGVLRLLTVAEEVDTRYGWTSIVAFARRPARRRV